MFGYPCELDEIRAIAGRHGLAVIADSAEALGAEYKGAPIGSHGVPAAFGFYPNKQITTGEGGVVTTHSEDEASLLRSLRNQGRSYESRWFHHVRVGFNYRFTDLQAAVGIAQLEKLDEILSMRAAAAARYGELLHGVEGVETPYRDDSDHRRSWFVYVVKLARGIDRDAVLERLADEGIEAGHYVPCVHLQPYMRERYGFAEGTCPVAEDAASRTIALPFFVDHRARGPGARGRGSARCNRLRGLSRPLGQASGFPGPLPLVRFADRRYAPPDRIRLVAERAQRMVFLGFGKYARADKIYALEPLRGDERGGGRRTRVWIEGVAEPIVAGRTERTILHEMGQDAATSAPLIDEALALAERIVEDADKGRVDLGDLSRRARRLLERTSSPDESEQLF